MQRLQEYVRSSIAQVQGLLKRKDMPTDLQLHRYVCELVRVLSELSAGAPEGLRREVSRPFAGFWDFQHNAPLRTTKLTVHHLVYVLGQLEELLLKTPEVSTEVAVREINQEARTLLAKTPFDNIKQALLKPEGVLIRGVRVRYAFTLDEKQSHHTCTWSFHCAGRDVSESVLYWDEHFDYGRSHSDSGASDDDDMDVESLDACGDDAASGQGDNADQVAMSAA